MNAKSEIKPTREKKTEKEKTAGHLSRPFEDFDLMFNRFMDQVYPRSWHLPARWEFPEMPHPFAGKRPNIDVIDREDEILVRAELPGVEKQDLDISMNDNSVTIKATSSHEEEESEDNYYRKEIAHGTFVRTIALPCEVDEDKTKASFENGVLELTMPKLAKAKRRKVTVK